MLKNPWIYCVCPTCSSPLFIATWGLLLLGLASSFVCRLRVWLVFELALLYLTVLLPRLDYLTSRLWSRGVAGPPPVASARFVFLPGARPQPRLPCMLPERPSRPLDWFGIWSMKEFYNLNCNVWDVLKELFHWPDPSNENWDLVHPVKTWIVSLSTGRHLFVKMSISMGRYHWNRTAMASILFNVLYLKHRSSCQFMFIRGC